MWMDLYYQQQQPLFYSRNTGQLAPPVKNWRIFFGAKFYCLHALADGSLRIRIREKTLEFSSAVLSTLSPYWTCTFSSDSMFLNETWCRSDWYVHHRCCVCVRLTGSFLTDAGSLFDAQQVLLQCLSLCRCGYSVSQISHSLECCIRYVNTGSFPVSFSIFCLH